MYPRRNSEKNDSYYDDEDYLISRKMLGNDEAYGDDSYYDDEDYLDMGLSGLKDSSLKREKLIKRFHLGKCNGKTLYKRLNMLGLSKEEIWQELQ